MSALSGQSSCKPPMCRHCCQQMNDCQQKDKRWQRLARLWTERNPCAPLCTTMGNSMRALQVLKIEHHVIQQFHFWVCIWRKWNHYVKEDICNNKSKKDRQILNDLTYICVETKIILNELIEKEISLWPDSKVGELDESGQKKQTSIYKTMCYAVLCLVFSRVWLCDPMDCRPPGSSIHGDSPGKTTGVGCHDLLQGIFLTQGSNPGLLHCRQILYCLSHQGSPRILGSIPPPYHFCPLLSPSLYEMFP